MFLTINDLVFFCLQALIIWLALYSLYAKYVKARIKNWILNKSREAKAILAQRKARARARKVQDMNERFKKTGNHTQLIVTDSVISQEQFGTARIEVTRSEKDWEYFALAWTVLSVFIIESNSLYNSVGTANISIALMVLDIFVVTYLCFISAWFRNKVIAVAVWRNKTPD